MPWLRFSPFLALLLALPAAAQSSLGSSSLGVPQPGLPQPVPRGASPQPQPQPQQNVLRPPPGAQRVVPAPSPSTGQTRPAERPSAAPRAAPAPTRSQAPARGPSSGQATGRGRSTAATPTEAPPQTPVKRPRAAGAAAGAAAGMAAGAAAGVAAAPPVPASPAPTQQELEQPSLGSATGLPIPRFVSLRSDDVNLRIGPDTRFPIEWSYQRRDLPVLIVREFNQWRRIRDMDGTEGWVHQSTLAGRRTFLVKAQHELILRAADGEQSGVVAKLMPGVVGRIRNCRANSNWCEVQVGGHQGFLRRADLWGIGPEEEIN